MCPLGNISKGNGGIVSKIYYFNLLVSRLYSLNLFISINEIGNYLSRNIHCSKNEVLWIWSHLLKKSLMENFILRAVIV